MRREALGHAQDPTQLRIASERSKTREMDLDMGFLLGLSMGFEMDLDTGFLLGLSMGDLDFRAPYLLLPLRLFLSPPFLYKVYVITES